MALDLEEQEQLDEFKAWWKKNGKLATNLLIAGLLAYVSWQGYQYFQQKKSVEASEIYQKLIQTEPSKAAEVKSQSAQLMENYKSTPYAGRAALYAAKASYTLGDNKSAKAQLEWAIANAKESAVKAMASIEFASILFEEKNYSQAHQVLTADSDKGYSGLKDNLQGDIYVAEGKPAEAKKAYLSALENLDASGRLRQVTQQKLDALGS